jgi:hypothetical protein
VKATEIFSDGFESNDFTAWTGTITAGGSTAAVENVNPHHGTYNAKYVVTNGNYAVADKSGLSATNHVFARYYVKFAQLPNSINEILFLLSIGDNTMDYLGRALLKHDGTDLFWAAMTREDAVETTTLEAAASNPVINTWYCVEVERDIDNNFVKVYVDGVLKATDSVVSTTAATRVWDGCSTNICGETVTIYDDCVVVADAYIGVEGGATTLRFYNAFSLSPSITDGRRFSFSRQSSFSESFSYDVERSLIVSRKSIFSALFSINDGRLITLSGTSFFSQAFSIDTILSILKLNEYHFSTVITFSYSLTHGRSITIFRGSTFAETFSVDHSFSLFQFGHYSFSSIFNVPFTIYDVVSSTAPYGMGDVIAIAILALIIAICAAVIAITWD